jgi:DNA topoisomerase-1
VGSPSAPDPGAAPAPPVSAAAAGLRYVTDGALGLARVRRGRGFGYRAADGTAVRDPATLARIRALAIPPAWTRVWICPTANGHLQAVGRDARGRKQYRYHPRWREVRDETKYARLVEFGRALPAIRRRVAADLRRPGLAREKVLATVVRLLEATLIRVGNEEYARQNGSYGLTTLRDRHVHVTGARLRFEFRGKGGKHQAVDVSDRRLAAIVRQCQDLPGHELFQYVDDAGARQSIDSADVNAYLQAVSGRDFTAKDFRTWAGTVLATDVLCVRAREGPPAKSVVVATVREVADRLRNTPAVCRRCYVHPEVIDAYLGGALASQAPARSAPRAGAGLRGEERAVLKLLVRRKTRPARSAAR